MFAGLVVVILGWLFLSFRGLPKPGQPLFPPNIEANFVTSPLDQNGDVDYLEYLNATLSDGVTPETNAAVKFVQALGPTPAGEKIPEEFFERLGIQEPSRNGVYLTQFHRWIEDYSKRNLTSEQTHKSTYGSEYSFDAEQFVQNNPWTADQFPDVADFLKDSQPAIETILAGIKRTDYYFPMVAETSQTDNRVVSSSAHTSYIVQLREVIRHLKIRSNQEISEGNLDSAIDAIAPTFRLSFHISQGSTLVEGLIAIAYRGITIEHVHKLISNTKITETQLKKIQSLLDRTLSIQSTERSLNLGERAMGLDTLQSALRKGELSELLVPNGVQPPFVSSFIQTASPQAAMKGLNAQYNNLAALMESGKSFEKLQKLDSFEQELGKLQREFDMSSMIWRLLGGRVARGRVTADLMAGLLLPAMKNVFLAELRSETQMRLLRLLVALELFKKQNGEYPSRLDALLPAQLKELPLDPFNGQSFVYRLENGNFKLYSVGENQKDDEGEGLESNNPNADDHQLKKMKTVDWPTFLKNK